MPYWENLFPSAAIGGASATGDFARRFNTDGPDYITASGDADQLGSPGFSIYGPFAYFDRQYDSLAGAQLPSAGRTTTR